VTGWSDGGSWALAAAANLDPTRLVHVTSVAGGSYGAFGANWAAKELSKAEAVNRPIGEQMPGAVWHEVAEGGHFIAVSHAAEILAIAARELEAA